MAPRAPAAEVPLGGDDERLLIEAAKRDPRRFGDLYERNLDRVYAFVARRAGGRGEAEDVTAEVFHHALAHLGRFEWRGVPFAAWLLQIARNALADRWQRATREHAERPAEAGEHGMGADADRRAMLSDLVMERFIRRLAALDGERHIVDRDQPAEALPQAPNLQHREVIFTRPRPPGAGFRTNGRLGETEGSERGTNRLGVVPRGTERSSHIGARQDEPARIVGRQPE